MDKETDKNITCQNIMNNDYIKKYIYKSIKITERVIKLFFCVKE